MISKYENHQGKQTLEPLTSLFSMFGSLKALLCLFLCFSLENPEGLPWPHRVPLAPVQRTLSSGKKKANKHKHFRQDGVRDKQDPKGPKIEKIQDLEIFERDWTFQASHPPNPYFLCAILKVGIEIFNRDWNFQARLKISSEINFFQSLGP